MMLSRRDPLRDDDFSALDDLEREVHRPVRRPTSLIVPILITMIVMTGGVTIAWYSYNAGVKEGSETAAPLLKPSGPMKVAPDNPGGARIPHQEMTVYQSLTEKKEAGPVERILPPPEQPQSLPKSPPQSPPEASSGTAPSERAGMAPDSRVRSADTVRGAEAKSETPKPAESGSARMLVPAPKAPPTAPQVALAPPKAPATAPREVRAAEVKPIDKTINKPAEKPAAKAAKPAEPQVASIPPGAFRVQIGSVSTESQAASFWSTQRDKNSDLLGKLAPKIEKATVGGKTYYRIQAGPLKDAGDARALCDQLKRRQVGCIIVSPKS